MATCVCGRRMRSRERRGGEGRGAGGCVPERMVFGREEHRGGGGVRGRRGRGAAVRGERAARRGGCWKRASARLPAQRTAAADSPRRGEREREAPLHVAQPPRGASPALFSAARCWRGRRAFGTRGPTLPSPTSPPACRPSGPAAPRSRRRAPSAPAVTGRVSSQLPTGELCSDGRLAWGNSRGGDSAGPQPSRVRRALSSSEISCLSFRSVTRLRVFSETSSASSSSILSCAQAGGMLEGSSRRTHRPAPAGRAPSARKPRLQRLDLPRQGLRGPPLHAGVAEINSARVAVVAAVLARSWAPLRLRRAPLGLRRLLWGTSPLPGAEREIRRCRPCLGPALPPAISPRRSLVVAGAVPLVEDWPAGRVLVRVASTHCGYSPATSFCQRLLDKIPTM